MVLLTQKLCHPDFELQTELKMYYIRNNKFL